MVTEELNIQAHSKYILNVEVQNLIQLLFHRVALDEKKISGCILASTELKFL